MTFQIEYYAGGQLTEKILRIKKYHPEQNIFALLAPEPGENK